MAKAVGPWQFISATGKRYGLMVNWWVDERRDTRKSTLAAVEYFEKGLQLAPDNTNLKLHLGEAYLAVKRDPEARKQLDQLLAMKPNPEYMPEYRECVDKARKLIQANF